MRCLHQTPQTDGPHVIKRFFSSGWWIMALVAAITIGLVIKKIVLPLAHGQVHPIVGDGVHVKSYQFPLSPCLVPRKDIIAGGNCKNALAALNNPYTITPARVASINAGLADSGGYIQGPDRVIGVVIDGQARAYPVPIMNWHQVINDRLGGQPIVVTWDPFASCAMVFSRTIGGRIRRFGYSGLICNGNSVIYNVAATNAQESLWSPIQCRAITGPAAGRHRKLRPLPFSLVTWHQWKSMFPQTTMIEGIPRLFPAYRKDIYNSYDHDPTDFHYPVWPRWNHAHPAAKSRILALYLKKRWHPLPIRKLFRIKNLAGVVHLRVAGENVVIQCWRNLATRTVSVIAPNHVPTACCFLYVWHAQRPDEFASPLWRALAR